MLILSFLLLSFGPRVFAQLGAAGISGAVIDQQGAAVVGADVTVKNKATGQTRTAKTDEFESTDCKTCRLRFMRSESKRAALPRRRWPTSRRASGKFRPSTSRWGGQARRDRGDFGVRRRRRGHQHVAGLKLDFGSHADQPAAQRAQLPRPRVPVARQPARAKFDPTKTTTIEVSSAGQARTRRQHRR